MADAKIVLTAEDKTRAAFESAKGGLSQVSSMAAAAGFSLASLGSAATLAGLVNMVKSAANGIDAMNDLKDATGASIENISALESVGLRTGASFDTVSTSLIKFNQALGLTIKPGSDAEKVIKAIGLNAKELRDLDPAEALRVTAVALRQFADDGEKARAVQLLFGKSLKEVMPFMNDLAESGELVAKVTTRQAEEADKFNKELFKLGATMTEVSRTIASPLITNMNELVDSFRQGQKEGEGFLGALGRIGQLASAFTISGQLSLLLGLIPGAKAAGANGYTAAREGIENINGALKDTSLREGEINALLAERVRLQARLSGYLNSTAGAGRGMGGYENVAKGSLELPQETAVKKVTKATTELTEAEKDRAYHAAYMHKQTLAAYDAEQRAIGDLARLEADLSRQRADYERDAESDVMTRIAALRDEADHYGLFESQIARLTLARLQDARTAAALAGEDIASIDRRIAKQWELIGLLEGKELREANEQGAATAATAWSTVGDSFVDNLMRGGKTVAQYLNDLFRTLVLRPLLQPVGNMMQGMVNSVMGGGQGGGNGLFGMASNAYSAYNGGSSLLSIGSQWMGGTMSTANAAGTVYANATGAGLDGLLATNGAYGTAGGTAGSGAGGAMGAMAPFAVLLAPLFAAWADGMFSGESRTGGQYGYAPGAGTSFLRGPDGGDPAAEASQLIVNSTVTSINDAMRALGNSAVLSGFSAGWEKSNNGRGGVFAGGVFDTGLRFGESGLGSNYGMNGNPLTDLFESWVNDGTGRAVSSPMHNRTATPEDLATDAAQSYIAAIQASVGLIPQIIKEQYSYQGVDPGNGGMDANYGEQTLQGDRWVRVFDEAMRQSVKDLGLLPTRIADLIVDIDPEALSAEATRDITVKIQALVANVNGFDAVVGSFAGGVANLTNLTFDARASLVEFSGGIELFAGNLMSFVDNFYTDAEKRAALASQISTTLEGAGISIDAQQLLATTREQFRELVESQDLTTASGQKAYAALLSVNGAVASLTEATSSLSSAAADAASEMSAWQDAYFASWAAIGQAQSSAAAANNQFVGSVMSIVQDKWNQLFTGIKDQIKAIRGEWSGQLSADNNAAAQAQYQAALATVMAGGRGAQEAAASLPQLAQAVAAQGAAQAGSRLELLTLQAGTAQSLQDTLYPLRLLQATQQSQLASAFSGSSVSSSASLARTATRATNRDLDDLGVSSSTGTAILRELRALRELTQAVAINGAQTKNNTRELRLRGVYVLPSPTGEAIVTTP